MVAVAQERWSLKRSLDYSDLTGRNLVLWKSGGLGEVPVRGDHTWRFDCNGNN